MADVLFTIGENPSARFDKALARNVPERSISRSRITRMIAEGSVYVNGVVVIDQKAKVYEGETLLKNTLKQTLVRLVCFGTR